jgi:mRNA-degrading endonuclease RelE of RelBE toxin-antitoxin system
MAPSSYRVQTSAHFDRLMKKLAPKHPDLAGRFEEAVAVPSVDPHNSTNKYPIKKLSSVSPGDGQYRLRSGRFRFRYDVVGKEARLHYCGLRREDTY